MESTYNVPLWPGFSMHEMPQALQEIFDHQTHPFKINLSFEMILVPIETGRHWYDNQLILEEHVLVSERTSSENSSKWKLVILTNILLKIYSTNYVLGIDDKGKGLPNHVLNNNAIVFLDRNTFCLKEYQDNLCAFWCLWLHYNA